MMKDDIIADWENTGSHLRAVYCAINIFFKTQSIGASIKIFIANRFLCEKIPFEIPFKCRPTSFFVHSTKKTMRFHTLESVITGEAYEICLKSAVENISEVKHLEIWDKKFMKHPDLIIGLTKTVESLDIDCLSSSS